MGFSVVLEGFSERMWVDGQQCGLPAVRAVFLEEKASSSGQGHGLLQSGLDCLHFYNLFGPSFTWTNLLSPVTSKALLSSVSSCSSGTPAHSPPPRLCSYCPQPPEPILCPGLMLLLIQPGLSGQAQMPPPLRRNLSVHGPFHPLSCYSSYNLNYLSCVSSDGFMGT